jgi:uncharacterized glyoxalase superfamily protein PhnB
MTVGFMVVPASSADSADSQAAEYFTNADASVLPDFALMAGDTPPGVPYEVVKGVMLALTYRSAAEGQRVFAAARSSARAR